VQKKGLSILSNSSQKYKARIVWKMQLEPQWSLQNEYPN